MKVTQMLELTQLLEEMKEAVSNWRLTDEEFSMDVFEDFVTFTFDADSEFLVMDLKEKCNFTSENFTVEFKTKRG